MLEQTRQQMAALKLNGMLTALEEQIINPPHHLSFEDRLALLIDREKCYRDNQRLSNRLRKAKLMASCSMSQVDHQHPRGLNKSQFLSFESGEWVKQHRAIIITGPTGTGKTYLSQALAHKACLLGYNARYIRLLHLMHECMVVSREGKLQRYLKNIEKIDVLIIDDFGMMVMNSEEKRLLLEIIDARYDKCATIITSQLPIIEWHEYINDPIIADALLDRIVHHAEKIALKGESLRKVKKQPDVQTSMS
jgi:DNA replication protein DnaC